MTNLADSVVMCTPLLEKGLEQNELIGLDSPRCIRAIIHCLEWSRHCGATSPPYRTP